MAITVGLVSLGCSKNQVDAEQLLARIAGEKDFTVVKDPDQAEVVLVNTCGFIESAKKESIDVILDYCQQKDEGKLRCLVVTGCLAERYRKELAEAFPEVNAVVGIGSYTDIANTIRQAIRQDEQITTFGRKDALLLNGERILTQPSYLAYIKIAEGCDNCCSYCAIPAIRGRFRSRSLVDVCDEAHWLARQGVRELILVAQDTTRYGEDLYGRSFLPDLLTEIGKFGFDWIRVLYCYPERVTDSLLDAMASNNKIVKYLDIPIQHISNNVLQRMNRKTSREEIVSAIHRIRSQIPNITLRTTLITGFPGETEEEFEELMDFVKEMKFDRLGCFPYSQEEGTRAASMKPQIPMEVRQRRAELIMLEQQRILEEKSARWKERPVRVLVDGRNEDGLYIGRTEADAPEIDCNVLFSSPLDPKPGQFVDVRIDHYENGDLIGKSQ